MYGRPLQIVGSRNAFPALRRHAILCVPLKLGVPS